MVELRNWVILNCRVTEIKTYDRALWYPFYWCSLSGLMEVMVVVCCLNLLQVSFCFINEYIGGFCHIVLEK